MTIACYSRMKEFVSLLLLSLLVFLMGGALYENLGYPLFGNDEAATAMFGRRILEYGFPKVHGEKNVVYEINHPDKSLGIKEPHDLYLSLNLSQFYLAALGEIFARTIPDPYLKTFLMRLPFTSLGVVGLLLLATTVASLLRDGTKDNLKLRLVILATMLFSVPVLLHLRYLRYYSILILVVNYLLFVYIRFRYLNAVKLRSYQVQLLLGLFLLVIVLVLPQ